MTGAPLRSNTIVRAVARSTNPPHRRGRTDQLLTQSHAGVASGLVISRDLARDMGGDLTAGSTTDASSVSALTLPAT